jgi:hypothetical protein
MALSAGDDRYRDRATAGENLNEPTRTRRRYACALSITDSSAAGHGPLAQPEPIPTTRSDLYREGTLAGPPSPRRTSSAVGRNSSSTMPRGSTTNLRTVGSWRLARVLITAIVLLIVSRSRW